MMRKYYLLNQIKNADNKKKMRQDIQYFQTNNYSILYQVKQTMEETPQIHVSPLYNLQQHQHQEQYQIMEQTLHILSSCKRSSNIANKISYFMIRVSLSKTFDPKQFKIISSIPPKEWIKSQKELMKKITSNKKLKEKYFDLFLMNHTKIANWYLLAIRQKGDIKPYIFKQMFMQRRQQSIIQDNFNNEKVKQSLLNRRKWSDQEKTKNPIQQLGLILNPSQQINRHSFVSEKESNTLSENNLESENVSFMKPTFLPLKMKKSHLKGKDGKEPNYQDLFKEPKANESPSNSVNKQKQQIMGVFFNNMIELNQQQNKRKPLNLKLYKLKKKQQIDSHDLYMKTFDACNGRKYIFYDYQKHMKGLKQKNKYNFCLRNGAMQATMESYLNEINNPTTPNSQDKNLSNYQEFQDFRKIQQAKEKCSLLPMNLVLNERQLNNYRGLKKVVCDNKSRKVVFVNHQGKPITYYIKQEQRNYQTANNTLKNTKRGNMKPQLGLRNSQGAEQVKNPMTVENSRTLR